MRRISDEKHPAAAELVGDTLVGLPRRHFDDLDIDVRTDRPGEQPAAVIGGELGSAVANFRKGLDQGAKKDTPEEEKTELPS